MTDKIIPAEEVKAILKPTIKELRAEIERLHKHAVIAAIVQTIGGEVEGHPTSSVNYLQRLRAVLADNEKLRATGRVSLILSTKQGAAAAPPTPSPTSVRYTR